MTLNYIIVIHKRLFVIQSTHDNSKDYKMVGHENKLNSIKNINHLKNISLAHKPHV